MKLIVISNPVSIPDEMESLVQLFEAGLSHFHLRKPEFSEDDLKLYLSKLPPKYYKNIVIHSHYSLIKKYNLKGIHFPSWYIKKADEKELLTTIKTANSRGLSVSTSVHSLDEVNNLSNRFSYCFLSPVFDSISKKDYTSSIDLKELKKFFNQRVKQKPEIIALGGINDATAGIAAETGFQGIAALGYLWENRENAASTIIQRFERLKTKCQIQGHIY